MSLFGSALFLHVLFAVVLVASSVFAPLTRAAIRDAESVSALRSWLGYARRCTRANPLCAAVVLLTGVYLARGRWSEAWLVASTVLFVASSAIAIAIVERTGERLARLAAAAGEGAVGEELDRLRRSSRWEVAADALLANDVALLFLMVVQPPLAIALAAIVVPHAAAFAARALRRRRVAAPAAELRGV